MWYDYSGAPVDFTAGDKLALDFASYDTTNSTASGQATFLTPRGDSATAPFSLPNVFLLSSVMVVVSSVVG
jgi:hypothetical protein